LTEQQGTAVVTNDIHATALVILVQNIGPGNACENGKHFRLEIEGGAIENLHRKDHCFPRPNQPLIVKKIEPRCGVKGFLFDFEKRDLLFRGRLLLRVFLDLGDPGAVDGRGSANINKRLDVLIAPPVVQKGFNDLLFVFGQRSLALTGRHFQHSRFATV
jgi:hypothetical protein